MKKCVRIIINQDLSVRLTWDFTIKEAEKYSMKGWVKNESNGSVVVEAEGEEPYIDAFILVLKNGPAWARVDNIKLQSLPLCNFKDFSVKY